MLVFLIHSIVKISQTIVSVEPEMDYLDQSVAVILLEILLLCSLGAVQRQGDLEQLLVEMLQSLLPPGILLPKAFVDTLDLAHAEVNTVLQGSSIVLTKKTSKKKMTLKDMVRGMNSADPHELVDWGRPMGKEIW